MHFFDYFFEANWDELYAFFSKGNPPLLVVLLAINTLFFMYFMIRRIRGRPALRPHVASTVQSLLLASNMFAIFFDEISQSIKMLR